MAESGQDDLADALARMASGDVAPSEQMPAGEPEPPAAKPRAVTPAARPGPPGPAAARSPAVPAAPRSAAAPAAPKSPAAARPPAAPAVTRAPRPAAPGTAARGTGAPTAAAPAARPASPAAPPVAARPQRPTAPTASVPAPAAPVETPDVIDDDDSVIVPAYETAKLARPSTSAALARAKVAKHKRLEFRRTFIPVLLTTGVLMFLFGVAKFLIGDESSLSSLPNWMPMVLFAGALVMLGLAAVNMLSVCKEMAADAG
jgi:hypothetical protein